MTFLNIGPNYIFGIDEARHFKCRVLIYIEQYDCMRDKLSSIGVYSGSRGL